MNPAQDTADTLDAVATLLREAGRVLFITGAGISADSGLPTYRGIGGLYERELTAEGLRIEDALSGAMFARRPDITWKYLAEIERNCRGARPNTAHRAIAAIERAHPGSLVFTQNVDGFHRSAGSKSLVEIHGSLHHLLCTECGRGRNVEDYAGLAFPPECPACGGLLRPDVVLFGEALPMNGINRLEHALGEGFDLIFTIGTTSVFPYIAAPVVWGRQRGVPTVEINPGESQVSAIVRHRLRLGAAEAMSALAGRLGLDASEL